MNTRKQTLAEQDAREAIGERQFHSFEPQNTDDSINLVNAEEALERLEARRQEISRLQFLIRDDERDLAERVIREGWFDLVRVNTRGFKRRMRRMEELAAMRTQGEET